MATWDDFADWDAFPDADPLEAKQFAYKELAKQELAQGAFGSDVRAVGAQIGEQFLGLANRMLGRGEAADEAHRWAQAYEEAAQELSPSTPARFGRALASSLIPSAVAAKATKSGAGAIGLAALTEGSQSLQEGGDAGLQGSDLYSYAARQAAAEAIPAAVFQAAGRFIPGLGGTEAALAGQGTRSLGRAAIGVGSEAAEEAITAGLQLAQGVGAGVYPEQSMGQVGQSIGEAALLGAAGAGIAQAPGMLARPNEADRMREFRTSEDRDVHRTISSDQALQFTSPENVDEVVRQFAQAGRADALAPLAAKEQPSRADWKQAGLPENIGRSGEARARFAATLRDVLAAQAQTQGPVAEEPPPTEFEPPAVQLPAGELERVDRGPQPVSPPIAIDDTGASQLAATQVMSDEEMAALKARQIAESNQQRAASLAEPVSEAEMLPPGARITKLLETGPVSITDGKWTYMVRNVKDGKVFTKQGRVLPLAKVESGEYMVQQVVPQPKSTGLKGTTPKNEPAETLPAEQEQIAAAVTQEIESAEPERVSTPAPAGSPPEPAPAEEAVSPLRQVGESHRMADIDTVVADAQRIDGIDYELYNESSIGGNRAVVRVVDAESGNVVTIKSYPDFEQAAREYATAVTAVGGTVRPGVKPKESNATPLPETPSPEPPPATSAAPGGREAAVDQAVQETETLTPGAPDAQEAEAQAEAPAPTGVLKKKRKKKDAEPKIQARVAPDPVQAKLEAPTRAKPLAAQEVIATLSKSFGVPIRSGRTGMPRRVAGIYKRQPEVVRTRGKFNADLGVVAHEVGHHLDKTTGILNSAPADVLDTLKGMDYDPKQKRAFEGFAELVRKRWTGEAVPDNVSQWLDQTLDKETKAKFDKAQELVTQWREQGAAARAESQRRPVGWQARPVDQPAWERLTEGGKQLLKTISYEFADRFEAVKAVDEKVLGKGYDPEGDATAYELMRAFNMSQSAHAERALQDGFHTVSKDHRVIGKGLKDVFTPLPKNKYTAWANYHVARHVLDVAEKTPDYNPGMSLADAEFLVNEVEQGPDAETFQQVSQALTQFNNDRLEMLVDAGVLQASDRARMLKKWGQTYTSLRRIKDRSLVRRLASSVLNIQQPVRGRSTEGSGRPIMDPVEATILNTLEAYDSALKQQIGLKLVQETVPEFGGVEGMGEWVELVPPNSKKIEGKVDEILDSLAEAGFDPDLIREVKAVTKLRRGEELSRKDMDWLAGRYGVDLSNDAAREDLVAATEDVPDGEAAIALWRPDFSVKPTERIWRIVIGGKPHLFELNPALYDALQGMAPIQLYPALKILQHMTRMKKLGATGISTTFAAGNLLRDYPTFLIQTKHTKGLDALLLPLAATAWNLRGGKANEAVKLWREFGGKIATRLGQDYDSTRHVAADLTGKGVDLGTNFFRGVDRLRDAIGLFEAGPRIAEFTGYLKEHGYSLKNGKLVDKDGNPARPPRGVLIGAAIAARDVTTDFTRSGRTGRFLDQFIPFFNAAIQSQLKGARTVGEMATGKKNWQHRAVTLATLASGALLYALFRSDDEDYKEQPDWLKHRYFTYGQDGQTWLRIPKPHDWGIVSNLIESLLESWGEKDSKSFRDATIQELRQRNPVDAPAGVDVVLGAMNYSVFKGGPIESKRMENIDPKERAFPWTSPGAKAIGQVTGSVGLSPAKVDYILNETSGGLYGRIPFLGAEPLEAASKWTGTGAFTVNRDYSETVEEFYDKLGETMMQAQTAKFKGEPDEQASAEASRLTAFAELMSEMRAPVRNEKDREARFEHEKYVTGLARHLLGKVELDAYPNPLPRTDLPPAVQTAIDNWVSSKLLAATEPDYERQRGQSDDAFAAKRTERDASRRAALKALQGASLTNSRSEKLLEAAMRKRGYKSTGEAFRVRKGRLTAL